MNSEYTKVSGAKPAPFNSKLWVGEGDKRAVLIGNMRRAYKLLLRENLTFKKSKPLTYLAGPYTSDSSAVKNYRFEMLTKVAAWLMNNFPHLNVFSPITSSHPLHVIGGMRGDWEFWKRVDTEYLKLCGLFVVVMLDGWEKSVGVTAELNIASELKIPTVYLDPGVIISDIKI